LLPFVRNFWHDAKVGKKCERRKFAVCSSSLQLVNLLNKKGYDKSYPKYVQSPLLWRGLGEVYLLLLVGFATTSPIIIRFLVGVLAFEVTTIVLVNGAANAAL